MSITQTVEIPANHRLTIEVPREVPEGRAILTFTPATERIAAFESEDEMIDFINDVGRQVYED
jgi:hypothetical protein